MHGAPRAQLAFLPLLALACSGRPALRDSPRSAFATAPAVANSPGPAALPPLDRASVAAVGSLPVAAATVSGPFTFEAAAPDGSWLVTCQARTDSDGDGQLRVEVDARGELRGDELRRYLSFASGAEQPIDDLLASSPEGRWLVLEKDERSELVDSLGEARIDLGALRADTPTIPSRRRGGRPG